jgi:hypothetical protein
MSRQQALERPSDSIATGFNRLSPTNRVREVRRTSVVLPGGTQVEVQADDNEGSVLRLQFS